MERKSVYAVVALFQHFSIPLQVCRHEGTARAAGDQLQRWINVAHLASCIRRLHPVLEGGHVANLPWSVHFVAQAPALDVVGCGNSILSLYLAPRGHLLLVAG